MSGRAPRISACMIVKNEEDMLSRALKSVQPLADEIVVVDTGSTDRTVEIAESFGARVFHHPWEFDFAKHRNQSIDYAEGDWIFIIDADEELEAEGVDLLKAAATDAQADVISIPVFSVAEGGAQESNHNSVRLFRHHKGIRYDGAVHNEVVYQGANRFVQARLLHYGYDLSREKMVAKFHRTTDLLKREMARDPQEPKWPHYLAVSYFTERLYPEAFDAAELSHRLCAGDAKREFRWLGNYYLSAACSLELNELERARNSCRYALTLYPDYLDTWAVLTSVAFREQNTDELNEAARHYLELHAAYQASPERFGAVPLHTLHHKPLVLVRLALDAYRRDDLITYNLRRAEAEQASRDVAQVTLAIVQYLGTVGEAEKALDVLAEGLESMPGRRELVEQRLQILIGLRRFDDALETVQAAERDGFPLRDVRFFQGLVYLLSGNFDQSRDAYSAIVADDPQDAEAFTNLAISYENLKQIDQAERCYLRAIDIAPEHLDAAINLGILYAGHDRPQDAIAFLEQVVASDNNQLEVHLRLARLYLETNDADKLLAGGHRIGRKLDIAGAEHVGTAEGMGQLFMEAARRLSESHRPRAAGIALDLAMLLLPNDPQAQTLFGEAMLAQGRIKDAIGAYERVATLAPQDPGGFEGLAACYERLGVTEAVELCRDKAASLKKGSAQ